LGKSIHAYMVKREYEAFSSSGNSLMDFYAKSGALSYSTAIFNGMKAKDFVSWNIILRGHFVYGSVEQGLDLYRSARSVKFEPNVSISVLVIQSLRSLEAYSDGMAFHGYLIRCGLTGLNPVLNSILSMYADFCVRCAETLFDEMIRRDVISWSVMIKAYINDNDGYSALESFKKMLSDHEIEVDGQTMVTALKACSIFGDVGIGKMIHGFVLKTALNDLFVANTLVDFYCKCGDIDSAVVVFDEMPVRNLVSWNSLMHGFVSDSNYAGAVSLYSRMADSGVVADEATMVNLLQIFKALGDLPRCKTIHGRAVRRGMMSNDLVVNSLIDGYSKCIRIEYSWRIFSRTGRPPDVVTWSTMMSAFTRCGMPLEAIAFYGGIQFYVDVRSPVALLNLLEACGAAAEIGSSRRAHGLAVRMVPTSDVVFGTAILHMYSKCGAVEASRRAFDEIAEKNVVAWSALVAACGLNGRPRDAVSLLSEMRADGVEPNAATAVAALSACCRGGLVEEGISIFNAAAEEPTGEQYSCVADLLARSGYLDEAREFMAVYSPAAYGSGWGAVLSGSRSYEDRKVAVEATRRVVELEPGSSGGYVLGSSCFAASGSWSDAAEVRRAMKRRGVRVVGGYSLV
ncbi:hypothetical protein M569_12107, partial [Genlisea aurea]